MSKYDKKLKKALAQYESGNYEEALDICEKVLDKDYNNEEALILEGRSLEKLNRISDAIVSWKINAEYNNNEEARIKLNRFNNLDEKKLAMSTIFSETMKDEIKARLQEEAKKEYNKQLEKREPEIKPLPKNTEKENEEKIIKKTPIIDINIEKPKEDSKTKDINTKKLTKDNPEGESNNFDNVTKIDFHKKEEVKKIEDKPEDKPKDVKIPKVISTPNFKNEKSNSKKSNKKKPVKYIAVAVSGAIVLLLAYGATKHIKTTEASSGQVVVSEESNNSNKIENSTSDKENSKKESEAKPVTKDELNKAITNDDINSLYSILTSTSKENVPEDLIDSYNKAEKLMQTEGVKELYLKGSNSFKNKKYEDALKDFEKAYTFSADSYLRPHLVYFIGTSYEKLDKNDEAIKYFKEYLKDYKAKSDSNDFMYTPQCLYNLATLYSKEGNTAESKKYAQKIENEYPNTMFYNDVTKKIIYGN